MSNTLLDMLTYARPMGSVTELAFRLRYLLSLPGATLDAFGNIAVRIGSAPVLWSCHTDTVHARDGYQSVHVNAEGTVGLSKRPRARGVSCLGADDTVGIWLCREMILRGVEGLYLFHYGEERGGIGSSALARHTPEVLADIQFAIALDRRSQADIVTHQGGLRCCSDAFARSLATALNAHELSYAPDDSGIYTDTAEYTDLVGECTNLSIGYEHAHSSKETCSLPFAARLLDALCALDVATLVAERVAGTYESNYVSYGDWRTWTAEPIAPYVFDVMECHYCGQDYEPDESTADDPWLFCTYACEDASADLQSRRSVYLDVEQGNIQSLLDRQTAKGYLK